VRGGGHGRWAAVMAGVAAGQVAFGGGGAYGGRGGLNGGGSGGIAGGSMTPACSLVAGVVVGGWAVEWWCLSSAAAWGA
ncbi:hypothetical protein Dimus_016286, partial [Dionaea muscipula]